MLALKRNLKTLIIPKNPTMSSSFHRRPFSSLASKTLNPKSHPIVDYLITSCGFSSPKAAATSTQVSQYTSIDQAHSVRHFLEHLGFDSARIRNAVSGFPRILSADVDETLLPNLEVLRGLGFSDTELPLLVETYPRVLVNPLAVPSLQFWRNFVGARRRKGLAADLSRPQAAEIFTGIGPKISMLKEEGHKDDEILHILKRACSFVALKPLKQGVLSLSRIEWAAFDAKLEFFLEFGWSERQFLAALTENTDIIHLAEESVRENMKFLVERAKCEKSYVASNPSLLTMNLEKKLMPRHNVIEILKSNKLLAIDPDLLFIMKLSEKDFSNRFILRFKEKLPELHDTYVTSCVG